VELDTKMQKILPVKVGYEIVEPAGMILVGVEANPDSVLVTGPSEMFGKIYQIETETKVFEEPLKPFEEIFLIQESEEYFAEYEPAQVQVTFNLLCNTLTKILNSSRPFEHCRNRFSQNRKI